MNHTSDYWMQTIKDGSGLVAVCSSHPAVIASAVTAAVEMDRPLLIEATANQVNPDRGYTGMTPADFAAFVRSLAESAGLPPGRLLLGADHLGPVAWPHEPAAVAMNKAAAMVHQVVSAGFGKIHLDTGTACADDPPGRLSPETAAARAALLCRAAEAARRDRGNGIQPIYVVGDDVPPPGGGLEADRRVVITDPEDLTAALDRIQAAFSEAGLVSAWERVGAVVVQPGVEFGDTRIASYRPDAAAALSACHEHLPAGMAFEVHAADYQSPGAVARMSSDHFRLLKIGPCLTFAYREVLYALADMEDAMPGGQEKSGLRRVMEDLMLERPEYWRHHYRGSAAELKFLRHFSFRDRIRYYWSDARARNAVERLKANLSRPIPTALLHQYVPDLMPAIESGDLAPEPRAMVAHRVRSVIRNYFRAAAGAWR